MGIAIFSPRLDTHGNSVRGVELCKHLLGHYPFGVFDKLTNTINSDCPLSDVATLGNREWSLNKCYVEWIC